MGAGKKIEYFLVHTLKCSNKQARAMLAQGKVCVAGEIVRENIEIDHTSEITVDGKMVQQKPIYLKFYKPVGFVSSLNEKVADSLYPIFKDLLPLTIAGRLDKNSEGLLLLTNDGKWAKHITDPTTLKEKEYVVKVDNSFTSDFVEKMSEGVDIGFYKTKPCRCWIIDNFSFGIILTEGKNKQIRRMCKTLGYKVVFLKRIRVDKITIENQTVGSYQLLKM